MSATENLHSPILRQLEAYEESWQRDHAAVRECWGLEDAIAIGITTAALLDRIDRAWRDRVFRGTEPASDETNASHRALFELWLRITDAALTKAEPLEALYDRVEGLSELRGAAARVRERLVSWQPPRLSAAVGLREMTLSADAAAEFERFLSEPPPATKPHPKMEEMPADELKRRLRK